MLTSQYRRETIRAVTLLPCGLTIDCSLRQPALRKSRFVSSSSNRHLNNFGVEDQAISKNKADICPEPVSSVKKTIDQTPTRPGSRSCRHKRCTSGENIISIKFNEKTNSKSRVPSKKVFDPSWLKSALKSKRTIQGSSSKKKSQRLKSSQGLESLSIKLKPSLTSKLLPKFMLHSKGLLTNTDECLLKCRARDTSRQSQSKSAKKKTQSGSRSHKTNKPRLNSGLISHLILPKASISGNGLSSSRREKPGSLSRDHLKPKLRGVHTSSSNFLKPNFSVNTSSKRLQQPVSAVYNNSIINRKREFSRSLHEKVLSKISATHERLSSHGLHPADWSQFNLEIFKENWKKSKKAQMTRAAPNRSISRLDAMQSLSHKRNPSTLSKRSRSEAEKKEKKLRRSSKSKLQATSSRPVLTLMNQMKADISRLRNSLAVEGWKYSKPKGSPPSTKKSSFIKNTRS